MFAIFEFLPNSFGTCRANLRFLDGFLEVEPRTMLRFVDKVILASVEYMASSDTEFEVFFSAWNPVGSGQYSFVKPQATSWLFACRIGRNPSWLMNCSRSE